MIKIFKEKKKIKYLRDKIYIEIIKNPWMIMGIIKHYNNYRVIVSFPIIVYFITKLEIPL